MSERESLRVLVVDDEPLARRRMARLLRNEVGVVLAGECGNGQEAVERLLAGDVDLVLLDVQMPGVSGFDVLEMVGPEKMPAVVFVTAFDQYAVRAFDVHAVDYVLKPFDQTRLRLAIDRARARLSAWTSEHARALAGVLKSVDPHRPRPDRLLVRRGSGLTFVLIADIEWVEAQGNYAALHVGSKTHLVRDTLAHLEERLDARQFVRVRRTAMVNVDRVTALDPWQKDEHVIVMQSGTRIAVGRSFFGRVDHVLSAWRV